MPQHRVSHSHTQLSRRAGFTLIEILVSVAVFAFVVTAAVGAILSMIDASQKAQSLNSVMTNLNIALEGMARNIRVGSDYECVSGAGSDGNCTEIAFIPKLSGLDDPRMHYAFDSATKRIKYMREAGWIDVTAPEVSIEELKFKIIPGDNTDHKQPRVFMMLRGKVEQRTQTASTFYVQTLMTQRILQVPLTAVIPSGPGDDGDGDADADTDNPITISWHSYDSMYGDNNIIGFRVTIGEAHRVDGNWISHSDGWAKKIYSPNLQSITIAPGDEASFTLPESGGSPAHPPAFDSNKTYYIIVSAIYNTPYGEMDTYDDYDKFITVSADNIYTPNVDNSKYTVNDSAVEGYSEVYQAGYNTIVITTTDLGF